MPNNFYGSTQSRLKTYTSDRRVEERNGDIQQAKVYQQLAEERGDMETADRLAKLGMSVLGKVASTEIPIVNKQGGVAKMTVKEHIMSMIEAGTLSNWWEAIKRIPPKNLSAKARIVQKDIKHSKMLKEMINEKLQKIQLFHRSVAQGNPRIEAFTPSLSGTALSPDQANARSQYNAIIDELITTVAGEEQTVQELDAAVSANANLSAELLRNKPKYSIPPSETDQGTLSFDILPDKILAAEYNTYNAVDLRHLAAFYKGKIQKIDAAWSNVDNLRKALRDQLVTDGKYYTSK